MLADPGKQHQVVQAAVQQAAVRVPAGPAHAQQVAQLSAQISHLFAQIFAAGRLALADGLHTGFFVLVGVSVAMFILTLFLKDVPLRTSGRKKSGGLMAAGEAGVVDPLVSESNETA